MAMASPNAPKIRASDGGHCNGAGLNTGGTDPNLKDQTLTKLTHMAWMRPPTECSPVTADRASLTLPTAEKTLVPVTPAEKVDECGIERDTSEMCEGDAIDRRLILERRRNLVKSISKRFFRHIKPNCKNFEQFCFVDEKSLRLTFDKVLSHHRKAPKKADPQPPTPTAEAASNIPSSLNAQAPPFWPQTKDAAANESDDACNNVAGMDSCSTTPTSPVAPTTVLATLRVDPVPLGTQSSAKAVPKRGYVLNRHPSSVNSVQNSRDSQLVNRLDSQSQQREYLRATLDELDALRLNSLNYYRSDDVNILTSFVEPCETDDNNLVPVTASIPLTLVSSSMSKPFDSIPDCKPQGLPSAADLNIVSKSEYVPNASVACVSSAYIPVSTNVTPACSLINSSCQSKPVVAPYSTFGKENDPKAENSGLVSDRTVASVPKHASGTTAATVSNKVSSQSWPELEHLGNFESNGYYASTLPQRVGPDTCQISLRSDPNPVPVNYEARLKLSGSSAQPLVGTSNSRPVAYQSPAQEVVASCRNELVAKSAPQSDVHGVPQFENVDASAVAMNLMGYDGMKSAQLQRAVGTLALNLPAAVGTTATSFSPPQQVFSTGLRAISSCHVSHSHPAVNNDVQCRRSPTPDYKLGISEQYPANTSRGLTVLPDYIQHQSGLRVFPVKLSPTQPMPPQSGLLKPGVPVQLSPTQPMPPQSGLPKPGVVPVQLSPTQPMPLQSVPPKPGVVPMQPSATQPMPLAQSVLPKPVTANMSEYGSMIPNRNVFNQHLADRKSNASIYGAPSPPAASLVTSDQFSRMTSFGTVNSPYVASNPRVYSQQFVDIADIGMTMAKPVFQPSQNVLEVFRPNVSSISDHPSAPQYRSTFSQGVQETPNDLRPAQRMLMQNSSAFPSDGCASATSTVAMQSLVPQSHSLVHSHPNSSTLISSQSQRSLVPQSHSLVHSHPNSSTFISSQSQRSSNSICVPQLKQCDSYPSSSGSNVVLSARVTAVNQETISPQQSASGFDVRAGVSQLGSNDGDAFHNGWPHRVAMNVQDGNSPKRDPGIGVRQPPGFPFER